MSNVSPFVPATWGESYNLGGAVWVVTPSLYTVVVEESGRLDIACHYPLWVDEYPHAPLLPSPAFINAQTDPRAVAIAALERAGFRSFTGHNEGTVILSPVTRIQYRYGGDMTVFAHYEPDPTMSSYAAACHAVLHTWAAAIKWEVQE